MATIITYPSALQYWLSEYGIPYYFHFDSGSSKVKNKEVLESVFSRKKIMHAAEILNFSLPVHVAVPDHIRRNPSETSIFHKLPDSLPENSFFRITENIYIECPELCFVHAANDLSIPELVLLANNLCAIYILDSLEEYGQRKRIPVTTTDSIKAYIKKAQQILGIKKARIAIKYALDRSNSPMESRLAVLAALPLSRGGYGLIRPELNYNITLTKDASEYLGRANCCCDMVWKKQKVVLEYDSNLSHLQIQQHFNDKKRATALTLSGYKVISITAEQVSNFNRIETTFLRLRDILNMKTYQDRLDAYFEQRWKVVHEILLQKDSSVFTLETEKNRIS